MRRNIRGSTLIFIANIVFFMPNSSYYFYGLWNCSLFTKCVRWLRIINHYFRQEEWKRKKRKLFYGVNWCIIYLWCCSITKIYLFSLYEIFPHGDTRWLKMKIFVAFISKYSMQRLHCKLMNRFWLWMYHLNSILITTFIC